ncbi:unnamed protein product, partial [Rotaria sordida]
CSNKRYNFDREEFSPPR